jgi:hypothetical protein
LALIVFPIRVMKIFTIGNKTNNITIHLTMQDAEAVANAGHFRNEGGLVKRAADWSAARLAGIGNSLPGATPVKKFRDRATAVSRIWRAIQSPGEVVPAEDIQESEIGPAIQPRREGEVVQASTETVEQEDKPL